jgi:hypothetical protein
MAKRSWRTNPVTYPGFVARAVRRGLKLSTAIHIEEANDKTWLTITFKKLPKENPSGKGSER